MVANIIEFVCPACDKIVRKKDRYDGRTHKYCSRKCFYKYRQATIVACNCTECDKPFKISQARIDRGNGRFCSQLCAKINYHRKRGHGSITIHCPICSKKKSIKKSHKDFEITCGNKECTRQYKWNKFLAAFQEDYGTSLDQVLYTLYVEQEMSYRDITAITNLNGRTIKKALTTFGIPVRTGSESVKTQWTNGKHDNQTGENHYGWQGGNSINYGISRTEWAELAETIRRRDNYQCTHCGMTNPESIEKHNKVLDVHHIVSYILSHDNSINNLRTLCPSCHRIIERQFIWLL